MLIMPLHGLHCPNQPWTLSTPYKMLVAFLAILALVGSMHAYKQIVPNINPRILNFISYISSAN